MVALSDITGQRFGKLLVIHRVKNNHHNNAMWQCLCDCGNYTNVLGARLRNGHTKSCGCLHLEFSPKNKKTLTEQRFGRLVALRRSKYKPRIDNSVGWLCKCDCGKFAIVRAYSLTNGDTMSCGCLLTERLIERNTTHGLSKTPEYAHSMRLKRRELEIINDYLWNDEMPKAIKEFQPVCVVCGRTEEENKKKYNKSLNIDHVLPLSKGNGLKPGNAVVLCTHCNMTKRSKSLDKLPEDMAIKIIHAAEHFRCYWSALECS